MKHLLLFSLLFAVTVSFKPSTSRELTLWVNSYQNDCIGIGPMNCLLVQQGNELQDDNWVNLYAPIENFNYQAGYFYKVRVIQEVQKVKGMAADASATKYTLIEVLEQIPDDRFTLQGTWEIKELNNQPLFYYCDDEEEIAPSMSVSIAKMNFCGTDGYNSFHGSIANLTSDSLVFGVPSFTRMLCSEKIIPEFINLAFSKTQTYTVENDALRIFDDAGNELIEFSKVSAPSIRLNDTWTVERILGRYVFSTDEQRIEIDAEDMEAISSNGTQTLVSQLTELDNESIRFEQISNANEASAELSYANYLNRVLSSVSKYRITGPTLNLMNEHNRILVTLKRTDF